MDKEKDNIVYLLFRNIAMSKPGEAAVRSSGLQGGDPVQSTESWHRDSYCVLNMLAQGHLGGLVS